MEKRRELVKKFNNARFLMRMKYLAALPENFNSKFHIPINYIDYNLRPLSDVEIEQFIQSNGLIVP